MKMICNIKLLKDNNVNNGPQTNDDERNSDSNSSNNLS